VAKISAALAAAASVPAEKLMSENGVSSVKRWLANGERENMTQRRK
jgi:hypothetical protein